MVTYPEYCSLNASPNAKAKCVVFQRLVVLAPLSISPKVTLERHYFSKLALLTIFKTISFWWLFLNFSVLLKFNFSVKFFLARSSCPSFFEIFFPLAFYFLTSVVCFSTFTVMCASYLWFLFFPHSICLSCPKWLFLSK